MRVLYATAEYGPVAKVGGLGEASAGLVSQLRGNGVHVDVVLPRYTRSPSVLPCRPLATPKWVGPTSVHHDEIDGGPLHLVELGGLERPHPYIDPATGEGWEDNDHRFFAFSAAVAALASQLRPDVVHLNDWHTAAALSWLPADVRTVLSIHNIAFQGHADPGWCDVMGPRGSAFELAGSCNPMAGAVRLADRIVAVSQTYATEILGANAGHGLEDIFAERGDALRGIRNGIDVESWNPADDPALPMGFSADDLTGKSVCRQELVRRTGLGDAAGPVIGMACRLAHQKGVDLAMALAPFLESARARLVLIGDGEPSLRALADRTAVTHPDRVAVVDSYSDDMAHLVVAGSDLLLVPSRFEPCGLTQMQAMRCGTIPIVTAVGGLRETVIDADRDRRLGNGFVADSPCVLDLLDALHRATRAWGSPRRRAAMQRRGMTTDWSWAGPAQAYRSVYNQLAPAQKEIIELRSPDAALPFELQIAAT